MQLTGPDCTVTYDDYHGHGFGSGFLLLRCCHVVLGVDEA